jgi:hypothetical protein
VKVRWDFLCKLTGGRLTRRRGWRVKVHPPGGVEMILLVEIEPVDEAPRFENEDQMVQLRIHLPGSWEETNAIAKHVAAQMVEKLSFALGLSVGFAAGVAMAELLPETDEETKRLGEERWYVEAPVEEVLPAKDIDVAPLAMRNADAKTTRAMQQFNRSVRAENPCDRFLGLMRVLEELVATSKNATLESAMVGDRALFDVGERVVRVGSQCRVPTRLEFNDFLHALVKVRDHCGHLRLDQGLGIPHGDPRVVTEIEPLLPLLEDLARGLIESRMRGGEAAS